MKLKKLKLVLIPAATAIIVFYSAILVMKPKQNTEQYPRSRVVKITGNGRGCSGEQIRAPSGVNYILSAGHCMVTAVGGQVTVYTEDGRTLQRRVIAEDPDSDLMLIEGLPNMRGLTIAKEIKIGSKFRTFTHGAMLDTFKTEGQIIEQMLINIPLFSIYSPADEQRCLVASKFKIIETHSMLGSIPMCALSLEETVTTAFVIGGSSGGMAINDKDELIGVVSAGGQGFGMLVTLEDINNFVGNY